MHCIQARRGEGGGDRGSTFGCFSRGPILRSAYDFRSGFFRLSIVTRLSSRSLRVQTGCVAR